MRDAILNRISTRTFKEETLTDEQITQIEEIVDKYKEVEGPFGHSFDFMFYLNENGSKKGQRIGTYGLLRNVPAFVGGISPRTLEGIVDFGYVFEKVILELTELGYDTCWLGGTFRRRQFMKRLGKNQIIPAITPVGHRAEKRSPIDRLLRSAAQSKNRLDDDKLFFDYKSLHPIGDNTEIIIRQSLCLVRRGPSASNRQPWRLYIEDNTVHFYIERNKLYGKALLYDIQALDMGIALAHYDIGVRFFNKKPAFNSLDVKKIEGKDYIISVTY